MHAISSKYNTTKETVLDAWQLDFTDTENKI